MRTVESLLLHGADPNAEFKGFSPWQNALYTFPRALDRLLPIFQVLLAYGADPNAYIEKYYYSTSTHVSQERRYSALLLLQMSLRGDWENSEVNFDLSLAQKEMMGSIIKTLKKQGAKSKEWRVEIGGLFVRHRHRGAS